MTNLQQKKTKEKKTKKITIGTDEFCLSCMEWREYDEDGKCKVCRKVIKTMSPPRIQRKNYDEYEIDSISDTNENEEDNY